MNTNPAYSNEATHAKSAASSVIEISVVVLTKNEELAIGPCLDSLTRFSEVFVVDSQSTDATVEIAVAKGATVVPFVWDGKYPKKKQWALENCPFTHDWVLFVDADEMVTEELAHELSALDLTESASFVAYESALDYYFLGRRLSHGHKVVKRALVRRSKCAFPVIDDLQAQNMWEVEGHYQPVCQGPVAKLKGRIDHYDREPLFHYFDRHNRYSDWEAQLRVTTQNVAVRATRSKQGRRFDALPFKPLVFFLYAYVLRSGWRDGRAGFHYAMAHMFYQWQISLKARELVQNSPDRGPVK